MGPRNTSTSSLGKFAAYKEVLGSYQEAKAVIEARNPVLGEAVAVQFRHIDGQEHTLLGIGGLNGHIEFYSNLVDDVVVIDETTVCVDTSTGERMKISDAMQDLWEFRMHWDYV